MKPKDYLAAIGVALAVLAITLVCSIPMVAVYAYFIEPGHPQEFYTEAAQWIAPWSSYVLGPILFFVLNYWLARRSPGRNALAFAVTSFGVYAAIDLAMVPAMGMDIRSIVTLGMGISLLTKAGGAISGALAGARRAALANAGGSA